MTGDLDPRAIEAELALLEGAPDDDPRVLDLRLRLAWATVLQDPRGARAVSEGALALARQAGDERAEALARRNLVYILMLENRYAEGLAELPGLIETFRRLDDGPGLLSVLDVSVHCWEGVGDYARAMEASLEVLELAERLDRPRERAWAHVNLGSIHAKTGDPEASERCYARGLEIFQRIQYPVGVARTKSLVGALYQAMGRPYDALGAQVASLALFRDLRMDIGEAQALTDIGAILEQLGRADDAVARYRGAIAMFERLANPAAEARVKVRLGRLLREQGSLAEARAVLEHALTELERAGAEVTRLEAHRVLAKLSDDEARHEEAARHWRAAFELQSRLHDEDRRAAFERVKTRWEIERAEKDAEIHRLRYVELAGMQARLLESERLAVLGNLAAGMAHEVNNPLGALRSALDVIERGLSRLSGETDLQARGPTAAWPRALGAMRSSLSSGREAIARIEGLVQSLKRFAKLDEARRQQFDLNREIEGVLDLVRPKLQSGVRLEASLSPLPDLVGAPAELNQALMTLLVNAAEATTDGLVRVATRPTERGVEVEVEDTGRGMSKEQLEHLFEPGLRPDGARVRFRVGLPSARAAVRRHGGDVSVDSELGAGTRFLIQLPLASSEGSSSAGQGSSAAGEKPASA